MVAFRENTTLFIKNSIINLRNIAKRSVKRLKANSLSD